MSHSQESIGTAVHVLRLGKVTGKVHLMQAARHNLREIQAELGADGHIDPTRTHLNEVLAGPSNAAQVVRIAEQQIERAGIKLLRRDCVWAVEMLFTLPAHTNIDWRNYFIDSLHWAGDYTACPVLSATVHLDEDAPHMHVLLLPLLQGRMNGSRVVGYKGRLAQTKRSHFEQVGIRYGLVAQRSCFTKGQRLFVARKAYETFVAAPDLLRRPNVKTEIIRLLSADPTALKIDLGIDLPVVTPKKKVRTMAQIFTSKGKGSTSRGSDE